MKLPDTASRFAAAILLVGMLASGYLRYSISAVEDQQPHFSEMIYLRSAKTLRRLSLGYSSLLADIYWTRAVQYYGGKHAHSAKDYEMLSPLLDITTDLDPHLIPAYESGSMFLSAPPPEGAGRPDKAAALIQKGIEANPQYWRLYFTLGFVNYMDRHDYPAAQQAFEAGSRIPGALPWMKVMAATMAERAGEPETAYALWQRLLESTGDKDIQQNARLHLASLRADRDAEELEKRVDVYRQHTGKLPSSWADMIRSGLLPGVPLDPTGTPYKLTSSGTVEVQDTSKLPFVIKAIPGHKKLSDQATSR